MSAKKILKILLLVLVSLSLVLFSVDLIRLGVSYSAIQDLAHGTVRYAITGQYDPQYCRDLDADNTPCEGKSKDKEVDAARIMSIHAVAVEYQKTLTVNPEAAWDQREYLKVIICSERGTDNPPDETANYFFLKNYDS